MSKKKLKNGKKKPEKKKEKRVDKKTARGKQVRKQRQKTIKEIQDIHWNNKSLTKQERIQNIITDLEQLQEDQQLNLSWNIRGWKTRLEKL